MVTQLRDSPCFEDSQDQKQKIIAKIEANEIHGSGAGGFPARLFPGFGAGWAAAPALGSEWVNARYKVCCVVL